MTDVFFVCVREDVTQAEQLAEVFDDAGFSVDGAPPDEAALSTCGAVIVLLSRASVHSTRFTEAAQRAADAGKAVIASLIPAPSPQSGEAPICDLSTWDGDADDPALDSLFAEVDRRVAAASFNDEPGAPERKFPITIDLHPQRALACADAAIAGYFVHREPSVVAPRQSGAWSVTLPTQRLVSSREAPPALTPLPVAVERAPAGELAGDWPIAPHRPKRARGRLVHALAAVVLLGGMALTAALQFSSARQAPIPPRHADAVSLASASISGPIDMDHVAAPPLEEMRFGLVSTAPSGAPTAREASFRPTSANRARRITRHVDPKRGVLASDNAQALDVSLAGRSSVVSTDNKAKPNTSA